MGDIKLDGTQGNASFSSGLPDEFGFVKGKGEAQGKKAVDKTEAQTLEKMNEAKILEQWEKDVLSARKGEDVKEVLQEDPPADQPNPSAPDARKTNNDSKLKLTQTASFSKIAPATIAMVVYGEINSLNTDIWQLNAKYAQQNRQEFVEFKLASIAATYLAGIDKAAGQMTQAIGQAASGLISVGEVKNMASNLGKAQETFNEEKKGTIDEYNTLTNQTVDKNGNELAIISDNGKPPQPPPPKVLSDQQKADFEALKKTLAEMKANEPGKKREILMHLDQQTQAVSRGLTSLVQAATSATESGFTVAQTEKERQAGILDTEAKLRDSFWQNAQQQADKDKQERDKDIETLKTYLQAESRATSYGSPG